LTHRKVGMDISNNGRIGKFIVFEGLDGSGKSTQIQMIAKRIRDMHLKVYPTFEPTAGPVGSLIRQMLSGKMNTDQRTLAFLFAADRMDHLVNEENGIRKKIDDGELVICDRYYFSSYAYHAQYMDMEWVIHANSLNAGILRPDLTVFIDVEPETCLERIQTNRNNFEMYEKIDIMKKVRANYFKAFEQLKDLEHIVAVDGNGSLERVGEAVFREVMKAINPA